MLSILSLLYNLFSEKSTIFHFLEKNFNFFSQNY